jgi:hypothetical protein
MKETLISIETAKLANEKGFVDFSKFHNNIPIHISQSLLQKWLREVHNLHIELFLTSYGEWTVRNIVKIGDADIGVRDDKFFSTYEHALEHGLCEALKLIGR